MRAWYADDEAMVVEGDDGRRWLVALGVMEMGWRRRRAYSGSVEGLHELPAGERGLQCTTAGVPETGVEASS